MALKSYIGNRMGGRRIGNRDNEETGGGGVAKKKYPGSYFGKKSAT